MNIFTPMVTLPISMECEERHKDDSTEDRREQMLEIACFITPHGFGHATRMTAVLEALQKRIPRLHPHLFTTVPHSLFAETLNTFSYYLLSCDIGLVQKNGLQADLPATIKRLDSFLPFQESLLDELAEKIADCKLVLCDIAPLGLAVAKKAGIASVLIENFTWDWIYKAYLAKYPELKAAIDYLAAEYQKADLHIRCQPYCGDTQGDFECSPIFRTIPSNRMDTRKRLHCSNRRTVLISMGGIDLELPFIQLLPAIKDTFFILAGQKETRTLGKNIQLLARDSNYYHPDLINASDLVICKSGYSTIAECVQAGVPIATVGRTRFPESITLEQFTITQLNGLTLQRAEFLSGSWLKKLNQLCSKRPKNIIKPNGADSLADFLCRTVFLKTP